MVGTSIDNLRNLQDYSAKQAMQYEQGHNAQHQSHQAQQAPYYDMPNNGGYPQFNKPDGSCSAPSSPLTPQQMQQMQQIQQMQQMQARKSSQEIDIEELTKDINNNIPEDTFFSLGEGSDEEKKQKTTKDEGGVLFFIPREWREPVLLLIVYLLLSQKVVRQTLGNYIKQLNPDVEGTVGFAGLLIYGVLFVAVYFLAKKYLL